MVRIRLARSGAKKRPFYHVVVTDSQNPRDGRFLERIGYYDPRKPIEQSHVDLERLRYWLETGAHMSERVAKVIRELQRSQASS